MKLEPLFTIRANLGNSYVAGKANGGVRVTAEVIEGSFEGEKLKGTVLTPGADWAFVGDDGFIQLDVRLNLKTDDDVSIYMHYTGVLEQVQETETQFGDHQFLTQPRFECGHEKYSWLNNTVAVGEGRLFESGVEYRVYRCIASA